MGVTRLVERLGGRVGGLIGTLPSTIVPASIGIYLEGSTEGFEQAMDFVPAGMLLNVCFLYAWRVLPVWLDAVGCRRVLLLTTILSLGGWVLLGAGIVSLGYAWIGWMDETGSWAWAALTCLVGFGVAATLRRVGAPRGAEPISASVLLCRGIFAAGAIAGSVAMASVGHPLLAALASTFPAIFLTTMVSVWRSQGRAVQAGAVGPMMLGSASIALYAILAGVAMPLFGPLFGALAAWLGAALGATLPAWWWLRLRP